MRSTTPLATGLLCAIIAVGGFGLGRMVWPGKDSLAMIAIVLSLALGVITIELIRRRPQLMIRSPPSPPRVPIDLAASAAYWFRYHPGRPTGYVGYTDSTIMHVVINDDLQLRSPAEQFRLAGLASGFLETLASTLTNPDEQWLISLRRPEPMHAQLLGWLSVLQQAGTDNWYESTGNLTEMVKTVAEGLSRDGPITLQYWDRYLQKLQECLARSGTTPADLAALVVCFDEAKQAGRVIVESANLTPIQRD